MSAFKNILKSHWPRLKLRTILLGVLLFTASLPAFGALFFRIYENTLVRQTESELIVQGAVMAVIYAEAAQRHALSETYGNVAKIPAPAMRREYSAPAPTTDLSNDIILPDRVTGIKCTPSTAALNATTEITPILKSATQITLASVRLTDAEGCIIAGRDEIGTSLAHVSEVAAALRGQHSSALRRKGDYQSRYTLEFLSRASAIRVSYAQPIIYNDRVIGTLLLSRSPRSLFKGLYEDIGKIIAATGLIFLLVLGLAGLLSRSITRPVELLNNSIIRVARGERPLLESPRTAAVELQQLFANFEAMAISIDQRSSYIRDFATAVSHEFKTPLTAIRGALELLQDHGKDMPEAQRNKFLANTVADTQRLNRLVARLLELARADMLTPYFEITDLAHILPEIAHLNTVDLLLPQEPLCSAIARDVLETIIVNLINNSKQHGASQIIISAEHRSDHIILRIADNGVGIAPEDRSKIFDTFFTTRRDTGGTGLGLSISRSLLSAYRASIKLVEPSEGTVFEITLIASPA